MAQDNHITFYSFPFSPYAHRVEIALLEAKASYTLYNVNLHDKPEWFVNKVNPSGAVPCISYGGTASAPERPSDDSAKICESLVILEFLADVFPQSGLLPQDPVDRARARFFMATFETEFLRTYNRVLYEGASTTELVAALEKIQKLLPETGFAAGEWSIADAAAAPILVRMLMCLEHDVGKYPEGEGKRIFAILRDYAEFARLRKYIEDLKSRPSFVATYDEPVQYQAWSNYPPLVRA